MGTRHSILVQIDNKYKVAQYGQWDGYPSGQGVTILGFLISLMQEGENGVNKFKNQLRELKSISSEELRKKWKECGADDSGWVDITVSNKFKAKYPYLYRDCGADILQMIWDGKCEEVFLNLEFVKDSLWCEWVYVVDFDKNVFEVYEGFNEEPLNKDDRFYSREDIDKEYYPVKLVKSYSLKELPNEEGFVEYFTKKDDEEE